MIITYIKCQIWLFISNEIDACFIKCKQHKFTMTHAADDYISKFTHDFYNKIKVFFYY